MFFLRASPYGMSCKSGHGHGVFNVLYYLHRARPVRAAILDSCQWDTSRIDWYPKMVAHQTPHEHEIPRRSSRDTQCTPFGIATLSSAIQRMPPNCRLSSNTAAIGDLRKTTREMEKCASPPTIVAKENLPRRRDLGCCM